MRNLLAAVLVSLSLTVWSVAHAADAHHAKLVGITVEKGAQGTFVNLAFDRPFSAKSLTPSYERNFMQLILKQTKIDSARIVPAGGQGGFAKVFAYAYTPDMMRVRFLFEGADVPKGKFSFWNLTPNTVRVQVKTKGGAIAAKEDKTLAAPLAELKNEPQTPVAETAPQAAVPAKPSDNALLQEVVTNTREIDIHNPESIKAALASSAIQKNEPIGRPEPTKIENGPIGVKNNPSNHFARMAIALAAIVALFLAIAFGAKKIMHKSSNKLPFGKKERIIQVIATHYLGNKKSISLVRVAGQYMVVGTGNDGMNLLAQLGDEVNVDKYLEDRFWNGTFEKHLGTYMKDKNQEASASAQAAAPAATPNPKNWDGARDVAAEPGISVAATMISDKVEISSVRSGIKDKLSKLKPLG